MNSTDNPNPAAQPGAPLPTAGIPVPDAGTQNAESAFANVSVRAWLALGIIGTVCLISVGGAAAGLMRGESITIAEPLYSMAVLALGFYFGQKTTKSTPPVP